MRLRNWLVILINESQQRVMMNTFQNLLGETLPSFRSQIVGIKEAKRGWRNLSRDRHSISPKNVHRNLCRTSPLHIRTGWGGNSTAQCKENTLSRPDTICRSGCDVPKNGQLVSFNRWRREIFNAFQLHTVFEIQRCRFAFLNPF
jgi:hypothetical protein